MQEVLNSPGLDNLNIITSGTIPPNPGELMDSKRLGDFIEEVKRLGPNPLKVEGVRREEAKARYRARLHMLRV